MADYINGKPVGVFHSLSVAKKLLLASSSAYLTNTPGQDLNIWRDANGAGAIQERIGYYGKNLCDDGGNVFMRFVPRNSEGMVLGVPSSASHSRYNLILTSLANIGQDYSGSGASSHPRLLIYSATGPTAGPTEWISIIHDASKSIHTTGKGVGQYTGYEGADIRLVPGLSVDHTYCGETTDLTQDSGGGFGVPMFLLINGHLNSASATDGTTCPAVYLSLESGTGSKRMLKRGFIRDDSWDWIVGPGEAGRIYLSATSGLLTQTAPAVSGNRIQIVGYAVTADVIYFDPQLNTSVLA